MLKDDFYFIDNRISIENEGEHDGDNRFLCEGIENMMNVFYETHPGCTPIGICYEDEHSIYRGFFPMVFEDEDGNRFYDHIDILSIKEYLELENQDS